MGRRGACLVAGALTTAVLGSCIGLFTEPSRLSVVEVPAPLSKRLVGMGRAEGVDRG